MKKPKKPETRGKRIYSRVTPTTYAKIEAAAKKRKWTVSDYVEETLTVSVRP